MSPVQRRFKTAIELMGDAFTSGAATRRAIFAFISSGQALSYLSPSELDLCTRPLRLAYVPYDDPAGVSDSVVWNGRTFVVKKAVGARWRGELVARLLLLS
jgi:hypothetical protein